LLNGLECQMKQDYIGTGHHFRSVLITTKYNTKLTCKHCPRDRELLPLSSRCKTQGGRGDKMSYKQMIRRSAFTRVCSFTEYEFRNNIDRNLKRKTHTHTHTHTHNNVLSLLCPCYDRNFLFRSCFHKQFAQTFISFTTTHFFTQIL
jgi:hypothetical protein